MAKRSTGVGNSRKTHSHKTAKRTRAKYEMLLLKNTKNRRHNRKISAGKLKSYKK